MLMRRVRIFGLGELRRGDVRLGILRRSEESFAGGDRGGGEDDEPWGCAEGGERGEGGESEEEVAAGVDGAGPDGLIEGGDEDADDGGVDAPEGGLDDGVAAEAVPEGQDGGEQQEAGKEDGGEGEEAGGERVGGGCGGSQEGGEGEERARECLGCAVAGEEGGLGDPATGDDRVFQQGKDDVAAAEDEGAGAVEAGEEAGGEVGSGARSRGAG